MPAVSPSALVRFRIAWLLCLFSVTLSVSATEVIPPRPRQHFNDYARVISGVVVQQLDRRLADFERETSDQVVVAIFPKMQSDSSIDDYVQRVAQKWEVGLKDKKNGVVLFIFVEDRRMSIQVGYGLEGALPDVLTQRIQDEIRPHFQANDYNRGVITGVEAILAAIKGEYKGTGQTVGDRKRQISGGTIFLIILVLIILVTLRGSRRSSVYSSRGRRRYYGGTFWGGGGGWSSGGGGWSSGSSGGGGFSSGGGSFGGGGSSSSW